MLRHSTTLRVRYSETDQMGFVYYGQYATYLEVGRVETMRDYDIEYATLERDHGILMPVMSLNIRYIRPVQYDSILKLDTEVRSMPVDDMIFYTEIFNDTNKLVAGARVRLCFLEAGSLKRINAPEFIKDKLKPSFDQKA